MAEAPSGTANTDPTVRYEETLAMRDEEGAGGILSRIRILVAFLVVASLAAAVLVSIEILQRVAGLFGGMAALRALVARLGADRPLLLAAFAVGGLLLLVVCVAAVRLLVTNLRRALDAVVHVRVTEDGVRVTREGSQYWQSSGVEVPFDAITAVEYVDPEASSFRAELGDARAPKFFAGRSRDWVRLERAQGPAVYVGSDRPRELAEAIAQEVPGGLSATPY